jgi:hypothetical protein
VYKRQGYRIKRDRINNTVTISMPGYVKAAINALDYTPKYSPKSPIIYVPPKYYSKGAQSATADESEPLNAKQYKFIQRAVGSMLYYANAIDCTLITAVCKISSRQSQPTQQLLADTHRMLDYAYAHPDAAITYRASDMQLHIHSDASHLSETEARSRAGGYFCLGKPIYHGLEDPITPPSVNGPVAVLSKIIDSVCSSVAEAEYGALFLNAKVGLRLRLSLTDLGYPQAATSIVFDNQTAGKVANKSCKENMSRIIDMNFHWIRDRISQKQFVTDWKPGQVNLADFFTKAIPGHKHVAMSKIFLSPTAA